MLLFRSAPVPESLINIVTNDHGRTQKHNFSVLDRKYRFWANLVQKNKVVSLS